MDWNEELMDGIWERDAERVRAALANGADPNARFADDDGMMFPGSTPLTWAADCPPEIVALLIVAGATVSAEQPEDGSTSLHHAAENGNVEALRLLLATDLGPHLGTFDYVSRTPLHCAVASRSEEAARLLLEAGADVNANEEARIGDSPLREAVEKGDLPMVRLLLEHGADPLLPGWMQRTPLDMAQRGERDDRPRIRELVEQAALKTEPRFQRDAGHPRRKR